MKFYSRMVVATFASLLASQSSAATVTEVFEVKLTAMRTVFACSPDASRGMYRAAYEAARRFALQHSFEMSGAERQVADLHRGLRDGKVEPPKVNKAKCSTLVEDAMEDARLIEGEL